MSQLIVDQVVGILDLEELEVNLFRGRSPQEDMQRVFGGQVAGQALVAAGRTVEERAVHSLHSYFLRPGDPRIPIIYQVDRLRDGKSFATRRVTAIQHGHAIFALAASFQITEPSFEHQDSMPNAPDPENLPTRREHAEELLKSLPQETLQWLRRESPIDMRYVGSPNFLNLEKQDPHLLIWMRANGRLPDDALLHRCVIAYASDMTLLDTASRPHPLAFDDPNVQVASLDHAMWFHRPFRADEWLLYEQNSPSMSNARGFATGRFFSRNGDLVVSVVQEGLIRQR